MIIVVLVVLGAILIWPPMQEVVRMGSRENLAVLHIMTDQIARIQQTHLCLSVVAVCHRCAILVRPVTLLLELVVVSAILVRPALLVTPMRSLAAVRWAIICRLRWAIICRLRCAILIRPALKIAAVVREIILVGLVDIWDLALKDLDTMRVLQQNQQLALRIIILADLVLADIMTDLVVLMIIVLEIIRESIMMDLRSTQELVSLLLGLMRKSMNGQQRNAKKPVVS